MNDGTFARLAKVGFVAGRQCQEMALPVLVDGLDWHDVGGFRHPQPKSTGQNGADVSGSRKGSV